MSSANEHSGTLGVISVVNDTGNRLTIEISVLQQGNDIIFVLGRQADNARTQRELDSAKKKLNKLPVYVYKQFDDLPPSKLHSIANRFNIDVTNVLMKDEMVRVLSDRIETHCSICLHEFEPEESLLKTNCDHLFHKECLQKWTHTQLCTQTGLEMSTCPMCKTPLDMKCRTHRFVKSKNHPSRQAVHPYAR